MSPFKLAKSYSRIAELTTNGHPRELFVEHTLAAMRDGGFDRARHYEVTEDVAADRRVAILTCEDDANAGHEGFHVPLDEASLMRDGQLSTYPVVARAYADRRDPDWVEQLALLGRAWVEIPIMAGPSVVGVLACDWKHDRDIRLSKADCDVLRAIGALIGSYLALKPIKVLDRYRQERAHWTHDDPRKLIAQALPHLAAEVDSAIAAVFAFDWTDQTLTKIDQHVAPPLRERAQALGDLPERYSVGEFLTGEAWESEEMRHVVSFHSLRTLKETQVAPASHAWHTDLLGEVRSVIYAIVGSVERRYLLRFINRMSRPHLPFVHATTVLDTIMSDLRSDIDAALATQRSTVLQGMAAVTARSTELPDLMSQIQDQLAAESVANFAVACHQSQSSQFGHVEFRGPRVQRIAFDLSSDWADDALYTWGRDQAAAAMAVLGDDRKTSLSYALGDKDFRAALTIPLESGQTHGVLLVPLDSLARSSGKRETSRLPPGCDYGTISMLHAYAHLIGNAIEARHSQAKVDGARRALGLMGHELRAPLSTIGSVAETAVGLGIEVAQDLAAIDSERATELEAAFEEHLDAIYESQRAVDVALEFAPIVAKDSERLELVFRKYALSEILRHAVTDVETEMRLDRNGKWYEFDQLPSARQLGDVIGDPDHLRHAFKNVLRNAAKYSLPQSSGPMRVAIFAEPQTDFYAIKVRNQGHGIPDDRRDLIFEPWVRGDVNDRLKAIGGMGLGLYLTRHIVAAHRGEARFTSRFISKDPRKRALNEGFETVFELRISRRLKAGKHVYQLDGRLQGPTADVVS